MRRDSYVLCATRLLLALQPSSHVFMHHDENAAAPVFPGQSRIINVFRVVNSSAERMPAGMRACRAQFAPQSRFADIFRVADSAAWHSEERTRAFYTRFAPRSRFLDTFPVTKSALWRAVAAIRLRGANLVPRSRFGDISAKNSAAWRNFCAMQPIRRHAVPRSRFVAAFPVANSAVWRMPVGMSQRNGFQLIVRYESKERPSTHRARQKSADRTAPRNWVDSPNICHRERSD